jgi:hypothetical protein
MRGFSRVRAIIGSLTAIAWIIGPPIACADEVQFETADKVELHGTFYPCSKAKAPCVIFLHKIGGNRQQKGWDELAEALTKDFAVLSFDFRGHGDSTTVEPSAFWMAPNNNLIKGANKKPNKINYKDFPPQYYPVLANDVVAARRFLDQQNDAGACNTSNIIIIGAEEGAAIGALWMYTEAERYRMVRNAFGRFIPDPMGKTEGDDIASAIWLSIPKSFAGVSVAHFLKGPNNKIRDKVPMVFFYGDQDQKSAAAAASLVQEVKGNKTGLELTRTKPKKNTKLTGVALLGQKNFDPKTETDISVYLVEHVPTKRANKAWVQRDPDKGPPIALIPFTRFGISGLR